MRLLKHASLLAFVLPVALAVTTGSCTDTEVKCNSKGDIEECKDGAFVHASVCSHGTTCTTVVDANSISKVACVELSSTKLQLDLRSANNGQPGELCSVNKRRCQDNSVQECSNSKEWETIKKCGEDEYCADKDEFHDTANCRPLVINTGLKQCRPNQLRCSNNGVQHCIRGYWRTRKLCASDQICHENRCQSKPSRSVDADLPEYGCTSGTKRCQGNIVQKCNQGSWQFFQDCPGDHYCFTHSQFLSGADCLPYPYDEGRNECDVMARRCYGNTIQECNLKNIWGFSKDCGYGMICFENCGRRGCSPYCRSGKARPLIDRECKQGAYSCDIKNQRRLVCNEHLTWTTEEFCSPKGECKATGLGEAHCQSNEPETPPDQPEQPEPEEPEPEQPKQPEQPGLSSCDRPGMQRCAHGPTRVQQCTQYVGNQMYWVEKEQCPGGAVCWADDEGDDGLPLATCNMLPSIEERSEVANRTNAIVDPPTPCSPGEQACSDDLYRLLICNEYQEWQTQKKCATPGDCTYDGHGRAHCERGGIDPPRARRGMGSLY